MHAFSEAVARRPATLLKKRLWHRCFPVNFGKFLRTPFFTEHLRWLLLAVSVNQIANILHCNYKSNGSSVYGLINKAALLPFFYYCKTLRFLGKLKITAARKVRLISDSTKGLFFFGVYLCHCYQPRNTAGYNVFKVLQ